MLESEWILGLIHLDSSSVLTGQYPFPENLGLDDVRPVDICVLGCK